MLDLPFTLLDVFTDVPLSGNGLAVVHEADGLDEATMQAFARETRLSETTFVQSPTKEGADYRNRIFTPGEEVPFAGHPSLGTAVAVARVRGQRHASFVQQTGAGLQPLEVSVDGAVASASMLQGPATFGNEIDAGVALAPVGLPADVGHPELLPQVVSTGMPQLLVPLAEGPALEDATPDVEALDALLGAQGALTLFLFVWEGAAGHVRARSFIRHTEGAEDPATGSAAGPLCAYLDRRAGAGAVTIEQGVQMGRSSALRAAMEGDRVRVSGDAVAIVDGTVHL